MGFILTGLRFTSYFFILCLATLCLACGLYYIAELIEEHEKTTKKILKFTIWGVLLAHFLMFFEFPITYLLVGIVTHGIYYILLQQYPRIKMDSFLFIVAVGLFLFSHYLWFSFFTSQFFLFWDIMAFFMVCIWTVPFIFFISLTSDDTNLPYGSVAATGEFSTGDEGAKRHGNRVVLFFQNLLQNKDKWFAGWANKFPEFPRRSSSNYRTF